MDWLALNAELVEKLVECKRLSESIRERMFQEMRDKLIFDQAKQYAYGYAD